MADPIKTIRQSDLMNRLVVDRDSMEEMGRVEVLWMYPPIHRVLGFVCKAGFLGNKKFAYRLAQIAEFQDHTILVHSPPDATDAERVRLLESLLQYEVWSADGETTDAVPQERIGKITDCLFKLKNGKMVHYLFVSNGLSGILGDIYQLPPAKILSINENRVLVSASAVSSLHLDREGIGQKLADVGDFVREEAAFEWRSLTRRANRITTETKERLQALTQQTQELTQQTQERSQQFTQEAKAKVKILDEQLQEFPQSWVERLQTKSQAVAEQVKQKTQGLSQQVEEGIGVVLEETGEWFEGVRRAESNVGSEGRAGTKSVEAEGEEIKQQEAEPGKTVKDEVKDKNVVRDRGKGIEPGETVQREEVNRQEDEWEQEEWEDEWDDVWGDLTLDKPQPDRIPVDGSVLSPVASTPTENPIASEPLKDDSLAGDGLDNPLYEAPSSNNASDEDLDQLEDDDDEPWI